MRRFRNWLSSFMYGRNGMDNYNLFLFFLYFAILILMWIFTFFGLYTVSSIMSLIMTVLAVYMLFRIFSKNLYKRQAENRRFIGIKPKIKNYINVQKAKKRDKKTHVYRKCPNCKSYLRLKKIKGKHRAVCPRCSNSFDVYVR